MGALDVRQVGLDLPSGGQDVALESVVMGFQIKERDRHRLAPLHWMV
jgi:hypothetical protein